MPIVNDENFRAGDDVYDTIDIDLYLPANTLSLCMGIINERIDTFGDDPDFKIYKHALLELRYQLGYDPLPMEDEDGDNIVIFARLHNYIDGAEEYDDVPIYEWFLIDDIEYGHLKLVLTGQTNKELYNIANINADIKVIDLKDVDRSIFREFYPDLYVLIQERFPVRV